MIIKVKGYKLKYVIKYNKYLDDRVSSFYYTYRTWQEASVKIKGKWERCGLYRFKEGNKSFIKIRAAKYNGITLESNLGKVNESGVYKILKLSNFNRFQFWLNGRFHDGKMILLNRKEKLTRIKVNIILVLIATIVACTYYIVNELFDNYLQKLINESNVIQSLIVFLSISSLINIFHPFTLRKEVSIKDVDELANIKSKKAIEKHNEDLKYRKRMDGTL